MSRAILHRFPQILSITAATYQKAAPLHRPIVTRFFSTSSPAGSSPTSAPPSITPPTQIPQAVPINEEHNGAAADPAILTSAPAAPDATVAATTAAEATTEAATATVVTASEVASSSFSDTLLQPALALLTTTHDLTGLPWWLSIAVSTLAIRTLLLPVTLITMRNSSRMTALKDDIARKRDSVMEAVRSGDRQQASVRQADMQKFMKEAGVSPMRVLAGPLVQFPVFISFFVGLRRLSQSEPSFMTEGTAWFVDLAAKDPTFILPVICGGTLLAMTEWGGDAGSNTNISPQMRMGMRGIAVLSVPMTYWFPSAVFCYWIPNNVFSMGLGACLRSQRAKRLLGLNVDLKQIKGTVAERQHRAMLAREGKAVGRVESDPVLAAGSYRKAGVEESVKPVLLKQRPTKKKMKSSA